jgi:fructokinase
MIVGIELGGTKTVVASGTAAGGIFAESRFATQDPIRTLQTCVDWIREQGKPEAIGIGAFGPIGIVPGGETMEKSWQLRNSDGRDFH